MRLVISRLVDPEDFEHLVPIQFAVFVNNGGHNAMLGLNNANSIAKAKVLFKQDLFSDASNVWLKVTDEDAGGRIVACSNWKIYPTYVKEAFDKMEAAYTRLTASDVTSFDNEKEKEDAATMMRKFYDFRYRNTREAHILLHLLFTDSKYHGKGAGKLMVMWGNALADQMMLPCWVEASNEGYRLYSSCGYEDVEKIYCKTESLDIPMDLSGMRRPPKSMRLERTDILKQ